MSDLKEKKFGYIVNNQPCPGHFHPPYPPMPPPIPGVTMKDLIQYVNSYIDVRAKQIYEKIKEHQGGIDKQEIIDAVIAQFRDEIGNEVQRYIENHVNFEQMITQKIQQMDVLTEDSPTIQNLSNSVQNISSSVQTLKASVTNLSFAVQNLEDSIAAATSNVNALTTSMSGISEKVDALIASASNFATKDSVSQVEAQVSALNSALSSYATNSRVDGIDASVSSMNTRLTTLSNQVSDMLGDWASVKERTGQIPGILSDIASLKASASTFASKAYVDASISALSEDVAELSATLTSYATQEYVAAEIAKINSNWDDSGF